MACIWFPAPTHGPAPPRAGRPRPRPPGAWGLRARGTGAGPAAAPEDRQPAKPWCLAALPSAAVLSRGTRRVMRRTQPWPRGWWGTRAGGSRGGCGKPGRGPRPGAARPASGPARSIYGSRSGTDQLHRVGILVGTNCSSGGRLCACPDTSRRAAPVAAAALLPSPVQVGAVGVPQGLLEGVRARGGGRGQEQDHGHKGAGHGQRRTAAFCVYSCFLSH